MPESLQTRNQNVKAPFRTKLMRALIISTAAIITAWPSNLNAVVSPCASGTAIDFEVALAKRRNSFSITFLGGRMQHDATWQGFELPSELVITYSTLSNFRCTRASKCKTFNFGAFKTRHSNIVPSHFSSNIVADIENGQNIGSLNWLMILESFAVII